MCSCTYLGVYVFLLLPRCCATFTVTQAMGLFDEAMIRAKSEAHEARIGGDIPGDPADGGLGDHAHSDGGDSSSDSECEGLGECEATPAAPDALLRQVAERERLFQELNGETLGVAEGDSGPAPAGASQCTPAEVVPPRGKSAGAWSSDSLWEAA